MKKYLLLLLVLIVLTGCTVTRIDTLNYKDVSNKILSLNIKTYNKIGNGYKYYAPRGVVRVSSINYNDVLKRDSNYYYLFVDVVSYYHKIEFDYEANEKLYYSKILNSGKKKGYVQINKKNGKLFVQMVYNYAKIEAYTDESNINQTMEDISYILSSMKFNDLLLKKMYEAGDLKSKEEAYKLFDNKEKEGNFLEYIKEYDKYDGEEEVTKEVEIELETTKATTTTTTKATETTTSTSETASE